MPQITQRLRVKVFRTAGDDVENIQSQINSFLSGISATDVESVNITPIYSTILENTILQGYIGVISYKD
jgi:hypothetical protein